MTSAPDHAKTIFLDALEMASAEARQSYLDEKCGDDASLRAEIDELLRHYDQMPLVHDSAAGAGIIDPPAESPALEAAGTVIGPYRLLQQIGEGGMGVVYMADQIAPVRRKVALKIIKPGMDTREVIARFEAERQALALMDHPNIASVFDGGTTIPSPSALSPPLRKGGPGGVTWDGDSALQPGADGKRQTRQARKPDVHYGRPYFVMELVRGVPITDYCDQNNLSIHKRLELFVTVCHAVQHAHQKGIIHRDIKPTNVLVTLHDGRPVPKVIDFGVAKAIGQQLTDRTLFTQFAQMVGTPLYMSPEQAELTGLDIDTRGDIYSLGVLLYELLTGTTPFDRDRLKSAAFDEIRRMIREDEPPRPSTRLSSTAGHTQTAIATQRQIDPKGLSRLVRGDLDWIVMKALEKDRNRRYETANAFAADVERYLRDEPVLAYPPSAWYRFRKLVQRNMGACIAASAVGLLLVLTVITLVVSNARIRQEQSRTRDEKDRAEKAQTLAEKAQTLAEKRAEDIQQGLERLKSANALLDRGRWYVDQKQWDDAHAAFTKAIELRPDHVTVWIERGDLYVTLGLWDLAAADFAREVELREPETTFRWYLHALLRLYVGDTEGYHQACHRMRERFRGTLTLRFVEEMVRSSVLAPGPDADLPRLVELSEDLVVHQPWSSLSLMILATAHYRAGHYERAIERLRGALATDAPIRVLSYPVLAMACHRLGRTAEAREALDKASEVIDRWTEGRYVGPSNQHWVQHLGATAHWPAFWWDYLEIQHYYREARLLIDGAPPPDDPRLVVLRARAFAGLRKNFAADVEYAAALKLRPDDRQIRLEAHRSAGYSAVGRRQWSQAADEFTKAIELTPDEPDLWRFRAITHLAAGDLENYRQTCRAMLERFEKTADLRAAGNVLLVCVLRDDSIPDMSRLLPLTAVAAPWFHLGNYVRGAALYRVGKFDEAIGCFEQQAKSISPRPWEWTLLAMAHHRLGHAGEARHCLLEAARWIDEANRATGEDLSGTLPRWSDWHEPVVSQLLLREAEELVGKNDNEPAPKDMTTDNCQLTRQKSGR
jgi:serine/threonine protein kinase/Flp pilus assembly protein TadD